MNKPAAPGAWEGGYMDGLYALNKSNRQKVLALLNLIRHEYRRSHDRSDGCSPCSQFKRLGDSPDYWPWRDYPNDPPKAGDFDAD